MEKGRKDGSCPPSTCTLTLNIIGCQYSWNHMAAFCCYLHFEGSLSSNRATSTIFIDRLLSNPKSLQLFLLQAHKLYLPSLTMVRSYGNTGQHHFCGSLPPARRIARLHRFVVEDSCLHDPTRIKMYMLHLFC